MNNVLNNGDLLKVSNKLIFDTENTYRGNKFNLTKDESLKIQDRNFEIINRVANVTNSAVALMNNAKTHKERIFHYAALDSMLEGSEQELMSIMEFQTMKGYFVKQDFISLVQFLIDAIKSEDEIILEINGEYESSFIISEFKVIDGKLEVTTDEDAIVLIDIIEDQYIKFEDGDIDCLSFISERMVVNLRVM